MKTFKEDIIKIYQTEKGILLLMAFNFIVSVVLFLVAVVNLNPNSAVVKVGYGDIGGYRDGAWTDMLVFPIIATLFGIFHSLLAVRLFHKRGSGMTKFFLLVTTALLFGTFFVLIRLLREG